MGGSVVVLTLRADRCKNGHAGPDCRRARHGVLVVDASDQSFPAGSPHWRLGRTSVEFLAIIGVFAYDVLMNMLETISIDVYPWAAPTKEQRAWFDALSPDEKRKAIQAAINEGFESPVSEKSIDDIIREARAELPHAP
ncbi:hypothetical protein [Mesorhizobium sp.]|nr:hypothetical protein [Mesorhizobium sp.]TIX25208.1 MAG: hypothetical protein E5V35_15330 [Mesorhizobium sp.]